MKDIKIKHERIGLLNIDESKIVGYAHERHNVGVCAWCDFVRTKHITDEFILRVELCGITKLYMWSLGTSLKDTEFNRKILKGHWHRFRMVMNKSENWKPVFKIVESGRRGFLHIHVIMTSFCDHRVVLNHWRYQTGEDSNVHVSGYRGKKDPRVLARYLMKYLGKESSSYSWLGSFYGLGRKTGRKVRDKGLPCLTHYGGVVYGGYETIQPRIKEKQRKL